MVVVLALVVVGWGRSLHIVVVPLVGGSAAAAAAAFLTNCSSLRQSSLSRQSKVIRQIGQRLMEVCNNDHNDLDRDTTHQVVQVVTALGHAFTKLVDLMLSREIRVSKLLR